MPTARLFPKRGNCRAGRDASKGGMSGMLRLCHARRGWTRERGHETSEPPALFSRQLTFERRHHVLAVSDHAIDLFFGHRPDFIAFQVSRRFFEKRRHGTVTVSLPAMTMQTIDRIEFRPFLVDARGGCRMYGNRLPA